MTHTTDKLWVRILLIALCAALAAGGTFFAACSGYGRTAPDNFEATDFATAYIDDCMRYTMRFANWQGMVTASVAEGYGGPSFGCTLIRDGSVVWDTTTPDAVLMQQEDFWRYEETIVEGSTDEYNQKLAAGELMEAPDGGQIVAAYLLNDMYPKEWNAASGEASAEPELTVIGVQHTYTLQGSLNYPIAPYGGLYAEYSFWRLMYTLKDWALPLAVVCWALAAALAFTLARDARRRGLPGAEIIARLPFDAEAAAVLVLAAILCLILRRIAEHLLIGMTGSSWPLLGELFPIAGHVIYAFVWTAAGTVLMRAGLSRKWKGSENLLISRLTAEARVLFPLGFGLVFTVFGLIRQSEGVILVGFALTVVGCAFAALLFRQLRRLQKASERLAAGDLDTKVQADRFWPGVREQAEALDRVGDGIKSAVDRQLKGERLKTELITNVSHDLKTPITSIVSCAELLKKPDTTPEQAAEYVDMLDRQCRKLKKLTDDLIEASKASSGAIDVHNEPTDVRELLNQSVGEFSERLSQRRITPVVTLPDGPCVMDTDGQLLWRVLDNLLGNICKYAQPDTRAYIDLEASPEATVISLKNVSASSLNISAEALMERFVRGDASRSTEGSGLGLSIAQSLTRLLGGTLALSIDGDLFKAVLRFENREDGAD